MKLSEKQKEVIKLMRDGWKLYTWVHEEFGKKRQTVYRARVYRLENENDKKMVHHSTFSSLTDKKIINSRPYHLTELGKTIQL